MDWTKWKWAERSFGEVVSSRSIGLLIAWLFNWCRDKRICPRKLCLFKDGPGCVEKGHLFRWSLPYSVTENRVRNKRHCGLGRRVLLMLSSWEERVEAFSRHARQHRVAHRSWHRCSMSWSAVCFFCCWICKQIWSSCQQLVFVGPLRRRWLLQDGCR